MAQQHIDHTGNESYDLTLAKVEANFTDLYTNPSVSGQVTVGALKVDTGTKTATASGGAVTLNKSSGIITTEALTTAVNGIYTLTITNSTVVTGDIALAAVTLPAGANGAPVVSSVRVDYNHKLVIVISNQGTAPFNSALLIAFVVFKA